LLRGGPRKKNRSGIRSTHTSLQNIWACSCGGPSSFRRVHANRRKEGPGDRSKVTAGGKNRPPVLISKSLECFTAYTLRILVLETRRESRRCDGALVRGFNRGIRVEVYVIILPEWVRANEKGGWKKKTHPEQSEKFSSSGK